MTSCENCDENVRFWWEIGGFKTINSRCVPKLGIDELNLAANYRFVLGIFDNIQSFHLNSVSQKPLTFSWHRRKV